jgi:hypothetical protein
MTRGIREGVNMEKDGDSEEDNDEEVVKQVVTLFLIPVSCAFQHLANLSFSNLH